MPCPTGNNGLMPSRIAWRNALVLVLVVGTVACTGGGGDRTTLVVSAAASLTEVMEELAAAFTATHPDVEVVVNVGGSATLAHQVLEGAPVDVFASADPETMAMIVAAGLASGDPVVFATNRVVIGVPAGNPAGVSTLADLADPSLVVGLCAPAVPCGAVAHRVLDAAKIVPSLDTEEPDVRSLATKITEGEVDVGIVYVTDIAASSGGIEAIEIDAGSSGRTSYPAAALADASHPGDAAAFVAFLTSDAGRVILDRHGFGPP